MSKVFVGNRKRDDEGEQLFDDDGHPIWENVKEVPLVTVHNCRRQGLEIVPGDEAALVRAQLQAQLKAAAEAEEAELRDRDPERESDQESRAAEVAEQKKPQPRKPAKKASKKKTKSDARS